LITAAAGFLLASPHKIYIGLLIETLAGMSLVMASACVFNNYIDRDIDKKMARTQKRALPAGRISPGAAFSYAAVLCAAGLSILAVFTNWLVFGLGVMTLIFYVVFYGIGKRRSRHGTLIGAIPGAAPPAAGYLAVTNHIDSAAVILFLTLVLWQMPHFYAIAMYRYKDYQAAGLPVLPIVKGMRAARAQIIAYIAAFTLSAGLLSVFGYTGYVYLVVVLALGVYWLTKGLRTYKISDEKWGRQMFLTSLIVTLGLSIITAIGARLP
jgi:heme o synthase